MNHHWKKDCLSKRAFANKKAAEQSGQRAYRCPVCDYWHRTRPVTPVRNPVLRFSLIPLRIALICNLIAVFGNPEVRGDVTVDKYMAQVSYAIIQNMTKRGYQQSWTFSNPVRRNYTRDLALYFVYSGKGTSCTEQKFRFVLHPEGTYPGPVKVTITGFGVCYMPSGDMIYDSGQIDKMIWDAFK